MTKNIIILGMGGNCIDILDAIQEINKFNKEQVYNCIGFLDDNEDVWGMEHMGVAVLGPLTLANRYEQCQFVNGIGSVSNFWNKQEIISRLNIPLERFETLIHPTATVSSTSNIGYGTVILQHVTVASNASIGNHVIILPNSIVSHDSVIGDYTCIAGGVCISGNVEIGSSCYLGTNSAMIDNIRIGDICIIGMGSVVLNSLDSNSVVVGNPAKFLRNTIEI